jgi:hypothetical protein
MAPVLNLPLDEYINNTHSNKYREKRKRRNEPKTSNK